MLIYANACKSGARWLSSEPIKGVLAGPVSHINASSNCNHKSGFRWILAGHATSRHKSSACLSQLKERRQPGIRSVSLHLY